MANFKVPSPSQNKIQLKIKKLIWEIKILTLKINMLTAKLELSKGNKQTDTKVFVAVSLILS